MEEKLREIKKVLWAYIGKHGTIINNGNIDYILEQAFKEYYGD